MNRGDIVVLGGRNVFKVGVVIGLSRVAGKLRVRSFSAAAKGWSNTFTMPIDQLSELPIEPTKRQAYVIRLAKTWAPNALLGNL